MEQKKSNNAMWWLLALVSNAAMVAMMVYMPQFFWVVLPFAGTFTAKAFNAI